MNRRHDDVRDVRDVRDAGEPAAVAALKAQLRAAERAGVRGAGAATIPA